MKEVPADLQCVYCKRLRSHGGNCKGGHGIAGCLFFEYDIRGRIKNLIGTVPVPRGMEFPKIDKWNTNYTNDLRVREILKVEWDPKTQGVVLTCNCDMYINEFEEGGDVKPKLTVIKGKK